MVALQEHLYFCLTDVDLNKVRSHRHTRFTIADGIVPVHDLRIRKRAVAESLVVLRVSLERLRELIYCLTPLLLAEQLPSFLHMFLGLLRIHIVLFLHLLHVILGLPKQPVCQCRVVFHQRLLVVVTRLLVITLLAVALADLGKDLGLFFVFCVMHIGELERFLTHLKSLVEVFHRHVNRCLIAQVSAVCRINFNSLFVAT
mmetsp:Transcript_9042/g.12437  ORF Transcript_9042/g.12437 Transcript_9042/m.12437 type:complete len:201 (+) Transcript_9042:622-1224(+)